MACPECQSYNIDGVKSYTVGNDTEIERYECLDCGCEYEWEMTRKITHHGKMYEMEEE